MAGEANMDNMIFNAYALINEIDLNKIAIECGIPKKYTWEEPLGLQGESLSIILGSKVSENQRVFIFSFGSIVLINLSSTDTQKLLEYLKKTVPNLETKNFDKYTEKYDLHIVSDSEIELTDKYIVVPKFEIFHTELIATVIAKSVALEKTEEELGRILDNLENIINRLERGRMRVGNKELARMTSGIVRHEYNTIAYIMILDKPDITWVNNEAELFYGRMSEFFELNDRYEILKQKTDILNNIIDGFSTISHSMRGLFVEWIIVILILVEIILMSAELFK
jgi:required for meiotic nuclear division protein 1